MMRNPSELLAWLIGFGFLSYVVFAAAAGVMGR